MHWHFIKSAWRRLVLRCLLLVLFVAMPSAFLGQVADEYEVKAAFLYNFTKFIEWPKSADSEAFAICILGDDPFGSTIDQLVKGKAVYGRKIQVRRLKEAAEARQCQIVFVRSDQGKAMKLIEAVQGMPILTVGERESFARIGGLMYLSVREGRVSFGINSAAVQTTGLKIGAQLLSLAKRSKDERGEEK